MYVALAVSDRDYNALREEMSLDGLFSLPMAVGHTPEEALQRLIAEEVARTADGNFGVCFIHLDEEECLFRIQRAGRERSDSWVRYVLRETAPASPRGDRLSSLFGNT